MGCTCTHQSTAVIPLRDAPLAATTNTPPDPAATADAAATSGAMANARLPQRQPRKGSLKRPIPVTTGTVLLRPITPKPPIASDPWVGLSCCFFAMTREIFHDLVLFLLGTASLLAHGGM